ncbi:hypothetical protein AAII07_56900 [Microvirga sp. 0TCS3.31]
MSHRTSSAKRPQPSVSTLRLSSIRKLLEDRRGAGLAGATLVAEEERCFRAALPSILEPKGRAIGPGLALSWAEHWTPALLADRGASWIEELAAQHLARPRRMKADALGRLLELCDEERTRLRITTIGAIDKNKRKRTAERKAKDRERKRQARAAKGATPRAQSAEAAKPWDVLGISRRSFYRLSSEERKQALAAALALKSPQQDTLRVSTLSPVEELVPTARTSGDRLKRAPAPRSALSTFDDIGSLPLPALTAIEILRSRSFMEFTR